MTFSLSCKKLFLTSFAFWTVFLLLAPKIKAVNSYYEPGVTSGGGGGGGKTASFEKAVYETNEFNNESHSYATTENIIQSLNNMILGCATEACTNALASKGLPTNGAVGATSDLIASLYANPPASSAYYLADLGQRLNLTQPVYAQGIGFPGLNPLLDLWKAARNVAYTFFIFIFLIIGFAIMFRAKINPQTVVTIQSAIPKAVVALILVTFSYAIAGLMIDLMYLVIGLGGGILASSGLIENNLLNEYVNMGFFGVMGKLLKEGWDAWWPLVFGIWEGMGAGEVGGKILGAITGAIPGLILGVVLLFLTFKIFFALLMAYIQIIISIIIAPFQLMLSAIPGQNTLGSWLRNLTQNLLAFPAVILAFALGEILTHLSEKNIWMPPLLGGGTIGSDVITSVLSLGILLLTAKIPDMIKGMFEKKPFAAGAAIGEAMGPAKGIGKTAYMAGVSREITHLQRRGKETTAGVLSTITGARGEGRPLEGKPGENKPAV